ncbi:hypothetical protein [Vibrio alginolyticus]|uniref:hypothetical protein n=1 Tax=Vibrio alginolyticus TaxID=663 RepID=UPI00215F088B|nr:hypothetical protein [Vibrio alginolyticus]MCS0218832.1 hypothetical protein [Vibrio alginolyticus]
MEIERLKIWLGFAKFFLGTFAIGVIATLINWQIQNRTLEQEELAQRKALQHAEMDSMGKWLEKVSVPDIESRRRLAQYFSHVLISDQLRARWTAYYEVIDGEYQEILKEKKQLELKLSKSDPEDNEEEFKFLKSRYEAVNASIRAVEPNYGALSSVVLGEGEEIYPTSGFNPPEHPDTETVVGPVSEDPQFKECRHPSHGIEKWNNKELWSIDSGWLKGGSSPIQFCGAQKLQRENKFPDRDVVLINASEKHRSEFDPFKRDYYLYTCTFEDRWSPVYRLARSELCED